MKHLITILPLLLPLLAMAASNPLETRIERIESGIYQTNLHGLVVTNQTRSGSIAVGTNATIDAANMVRADTTNEFVFATDWRGQRVFGFRTNGLLVIPGQEYSGITLYNGNTGGTGNRAFILDNGNGGNGRMWFNGSFLLAPAGGDAGASADTKIARSAAATVTISANDDTPGIIVVTNVIVANSNLFQVISNVYARLDAVVGGSTTNFDGIVVTNRATVGTLGVGTNSTATADPGYGPPTVNVFGGIIVTSSNIYQRAFQFGSSYLRADGAATINGGIAQETGQQYYLRGDLGIRLGRDLDILWSDNNNNGIAGPFDTRLWRESPGTIGVTNLTALGAITAPSITLNGDTRTSWPYPVGANSRFVSLMKTTNSPVLRTISAGYSGTILDESTNIVLNSFGTNWNILRLAGIGVTNLSTNFFNDKQTWTNASGDNQFISALYLTGHVFCITRTSPGKVYKFNATNFTMMASNTFASDGNHGSADDMFWSPEKQKLYVLFRTGNNYISEIDPADLSVTDVVTSGNGMLFANSFCSDGTFVYVAGTDQSAFTNQINQYRMSDWALVNVLTNVGYNSVQIIRQYGTNIYGLGASQQSSGNMVTLRFGTNDLLNATIFDAGVKSSAISHISCRIGRNIYFPREDVTGSIYRMNTDTMRAEIIPIGVDGAVISCQNIDSRLWLGISDVVARAGRVLEMDSVTLETRVVTLDDSENAPFVISTDGGNTLFVATYASPGKLIRLCAPVLRPSYFDFVQDVIGWPTNRLGMLTNNGSGGIGWAQIPSSSTGITTNGAEFFNIGGPSTNWGVAYFPIALFFGNTNVGVVLAERFTATSYLTNWADAISNLAQLKLAITNGSAYSLRLVYPTGATNAPFWVGNSNQTTPFVYCDTNGNFFIGGTNISAAINNINNNTNPVAGEASVTNATTIGLVVDKLNNTNRFRALRAGNNVTLTNEGGTNVAIAVTGALADFVNTRPITNITYTIITNLTIGNYTVPAGCTYIRVEGVGGGGGGGGGSGSASQSYAAGGGGSGAYFMTNMTVTPGSIYTVTIGAGGGGGAAGANNGTNGGTTSFTNLCSAPGGSGGAGQASSTTNKVAIGGAGGTVATGGIISSGGNPGGIGVTVTPLAAVSGTGGSSMGVFGGGGGASQTAAAGGDATAYGAGGGGAAATSNANRAGGNGRQGAIYITEYYR